MTSSIVPHLCERHCALTTDKLMHRGAYRCPVCLTDAYARESHEVEQELGKVLGYPWYKDDQVNFLGSTEEDGVFVGDHVPLTLATEAVAEIKRLREENRLLHEIAVSTEAIRMCVENGLNYDPTEIGRNLDVFTKWRKSHFSGLRLSKRHSPGH